MSYHSGHGPLLSRLLYDPPTTVFDKTLTGTTAWTALDTTLLKVPTFVVPGTAVWVNYVGTWRKETPSGSSTEFLGLVDATPAYVLHSGFLVDLSATAHAKPISRWLKITGLTAGASLDWRLAHKSSVAGVTCHFYAGGDESTGAFATGPAIVEVYAA